jgi:hypothetical protein
MFRSSSCFEGNVVLKDDGICKCAAPCSISPGLCPSFVSGGDSNAIFAFLVLSFDDDVIPQIQFGIKDDNSEVVSLTYCSFISQYRMSAPKLPISLDGLGCSVRLLVSRDQFVVYLADSPVYSLKITGAPRIFLRITRGKCTLLTPFGLPNSPSSWFPSLLPLQWRSREQTLLIRRFHIRKIQGPDTEVAFGYTIQPLSSIPGTSILYFEVDVQDFQATESSFSFSLGFISQIESLANFVIGQEKHTVGFHTSGRTILTGVGSSTTTGFRPIQVGDSIGIGLDVETGRVFATHNGSSSDADSRLTNCPTEFHAIIGVLSRHDEIALNFGQRPFHFAALNPPPGWVLYEPPVTDVLSRGPPVFGHVEGYYRDLGGPVVDCLFARQPLADSSPD